jgi:ABC-2 type transport system ATP-binding protein
VRIEVNAIAVEGLRKRFDTVEAVADISFSVAAGELFGFLGPNGAGKSTTINMLTGLARPDAGTIRIAGIDCSKNPKAAQHLIGIVPDESNLYPELTGYDNLCFCGALYGMSKSDRTARADTLLKTFDLAHAAHRKFGGYSRGMKRKLTIAAGIIHKPDILFLDEPTTGIDVAGARQIRRLISELHQNGATIFLTTHYIEEAERLCDRIAFIVSGRIIRTDSVRNLLQPIQQKHIMQIACDTILPSTVQELSSRYPDISFEQPQQDILHVESDTPVRVGQLVRFLEDSGSNVQEARKIQPSLEDVFVNITGIEATAMRNGQEQKGGKR